MSDVRPSGPQGTDRNLLFGVLALQLDYVTNTQFIESCGAWAARKDVPLAELLVDRGWIRQTDREEIDRLLKGKKRGRSSIPRKTSCGLFSSLFSSFRPCRSHHSTTRPYPTLSRVTDFQERAAEEEGNEPP